MKKRYMLFMLLLAGFTQVANAQQVDSMFVNLYTDSLKKGTYNYINVDGLMHNGRYIPLDSNQLSFSSSYGTFYGNNLFIDRDCKLEKVHIKVSMKDGRMHKDFFMYIKKKEDPDLPTREEIMNNQPKQKRKS
ncbi:MAG TPA: hypothetical protein PLC48_12015 [Ferruginibacter sp.]|nr:hypothetical protein [Ferruginibacter sp.]